MHFLAGLGKKLLGNKAKKKIAGKVKGDLPTPKTPLFMIGGLLAGLGLFPIILVLLMVAVICYIIFAPIEGAVNFVKEVANAVGDFFQSIGNFFVYGSFANDKTTYYNELKKYYDDWKEEGVTLDVAWIAAATNYARLADLNESGECEPEVDSDGNVEGCSEETDYGQMTNEIRELVEGMIESADGESRRKSDDDYKAWMLDDSSGKSWIERHMEEVDADIPSNPEKKKDFLEDAVEQIFQMKEAYNELNASFAKSGDCGIYQEIKLCDTKSRGFTGGYANMPWASGSYQHTFWNCDKGTCSSSNLVTLGENEYGDLQRDELGFTYMEFGGIKFYTAAIGSYYFDDPTEAIGSRYRITTDAGNVYHIILGDVLADGDAIPGNNDSSPYCSSQVHTIGDMYFDRVYMQAHSPESYNLFMSDGTNNHDFDENHKFSGTIVKVEKLTGDGLCTGELGRPNFDNAACWRDPYNTYDYGQCTWFAAGRLCGTYGEDYNFNNLGHGKMWVSNLTKRYGDMFEPSITPAPGGIFSSPGPMACCGHVGFVTAFDGVNITIQEGNINGATDPWEWAITEETNGPGSGDWHEVTYPITAFETVIYPKAVYAVPTNGG